MKKYIKLICLTAFVVAPSAWTLGSTDANASGSDRSYSSTGANASYSTETVGSRIAYAPDAPRDFSDSSGVDSAPDIDFPSLSPIDERLITVEHEGNILAAQADEKRLQAEALRNMILKVQAEPNLTPEDIRYIGRCARNFQECKNTHDRLLSDHAKKMAELNALERRKLQSLLDELDRAIRAKLAPIDAQRTAIVLRKDLYEHEKIQAMKSLMAEKQRLLKRYENDRKYILRQYPNVDDR